MSEFLQAVNWNDIFTINFTADDIWKAFVNVINEAIELSVPTVPNDHQHSINLKRYPRHIRQLYSRKNVIWKKYKTNRADITLKENYDKITAECRLAVRKYEIARENKIIDSNDIGKFYRFVNNKMTCRTGIGSLVNDAGEHATMDKDKADILNNYFASVGTTDNGITPPLENVAPDGVKIDWVTFDEAKIVKAIKKIKKTNISCHADRMVTQRSFYLLFAMNSLGRCHRCSTASCPSEKCRQPGRMQQSLRSSKRALRPIRRTIVQFLRPAFSAS